MNISSFDAVPYNTKDEVACTLACIKAMLEYLDMGKLFWRMKRHWQATEYGYDFFAIIRGLAAHHVLAEAGLYDNDYIPSDVGTAPLTPSDLDQVAEEKSLVPHARESLGLARDMLVDYPRLLRIRKSSPSLLAQWIQKGLPACVNLGLAEYLDTDSEAIHSTVVYSIDRREVGLWDPLIGRRSLPRTVFEEAWMAVGSYYFVIHPLSEE